MKNLNEIVDIDVNEQVITVKQRLHINDFYRHTQDLFDDPGYLQYPVPMGAVTPTYYLFKSGWNLANKSSKKNLFGGGWDVETDKYELIERWVNIRVLGILEPADLRLKYRLDSGDWIPFEFSGMVDEAIRWDGHEKIEVSAPFKSRTSNYTADLCAGSLAIPIFFFGGAGGDLNKDVAKRLQGLSPEEIDLLAENVSVNG